MQSFPPESGLCIHLAMNPAAYWEKKKKKRDGKRDDGGGLVVDTTRASAGSLGLFCVAVNLT